MTRSHEEPRANRLLLDLPLNIISTGDLQERLLRCHGGQMNLTKMDRGGNIGTDGANRGGVGEAIETTDQGAGVTPGIH